MSGETYVINQLDKIGALNSSGCHGEVHRKNPKYKSFAFCLNCDRVNTNTDNTNCFECKHPLKWESEVVSIANIKIEKFKARRKAEKIRAKAKKDAEAEAIKLNKVKSKKRGF